MTEPLSAVVVGARCRHQGIGEFVARSLAQAGAAVRAVVGTSEASASAAAEALHLRYGIECTAYASLASCLREVQPSLVALCSPYRVHLEQLRFVAASGAHCLCEKPLWWTDLDEGSPPRPPVRETSSEIVDAFRNRGRMLRLVTQWPCTLDAFARLHSGVGLRSAQSFAMLLGPDSTGLKMIADAAPHPISLLYALLGAGRFDYLEVDWPSPGLDEVILRGAYTHAQGRCRVALRFVRAPTRPRRAAYAVDSARAYRQVEPSTYAMRFSEQPDGSGRSVEVEDPLKTLTRNVVADVVRGAPIDPTALVGGQVALEALETAAREALGRAGKPLSTPWTEL